MKKQNRIIYEFMGYVFTNDDPLSFPNGYYIRKRDDGGIDWDTLKNESVLNDWDAIMNVVTHIEGLNHPFPMFSKGFRRFQFSIAGTDCKVSIFNKLGQLTGSFEDIVWDSAKTKEMSAVRTIVKFIDWYNWFKSTEFKISLKNGAN